MFSERLLTAFRETWEEISYYCENRAEYYRDLGYIDKYQTMSIASAMIKSFNFDNNTSVLTLWCKLYKTVMSFWPDFISLESTDDYIEYTSIIEILEKNINKNDKKDK